MKIKNKKIRDEIWVSIMEIGPQKIGNPDFRWGIALNKGVIQPIITALGEFVERNDRLQEFEKKRVEEIQKVADRDERGSFIMKDVINPFTKRLDREYQVDPAKQVALDGAVNTLRQEYREAFEAEVKNQKDFGELLEKEVEVELHLISEDDVPKDELTPDQMYGLFPLIIKPETKKAKKKK